MSKRIDPLRRSGRGVPMRRGEHLELVVIEAIGRGERLTVSVTLHPMLASEMDHDEYGRITVLTKELMKLVSSVTIRTCNRVTGTSFKMEDATMRYEFLDGQTLGPFPESEFWFFFFLYVESDESESRVKLIEFQDTELGDRSPVHG